MGATALEKYNLLLEVYQCRIFSLSAGIQRFVWTPCLHVWLRWVNFPQSPQVFCASEFRKRY